MTLADINAFVNFRASVDTNLYSNDDRLISLNRWLHKIWTMLLQSVEGWDVDDINQTNYPAITTPLVASQRDYTLPSTLKLLQVKRVDVTYDNSTWHRALPIDSGEVGFGLGNDTDTDSNFSTSQPYYDLKGQSLFLYPRATAAQVTASAKVRVEYIREPIEPTSTDMTSTTKEPPIDEAFHVMIAFGMIWDYASAKSIPELKADAMAELQEYEQRLKQHYGAKDLDVQLAFQAAPTDYN